MRRGGSSGSLPLGAALVTFMVVSAYMQYSLGVLGPVLLDRFDLSRTQLGSLTSVLFVVASAGSPLAGRLIDRFGARRLLPAPVVATVLSFALVAVAPSYLTLAAGIAVAGVGMAFANPLSNKLVALHVPRARQGLLMGVKQSGVQLAAVIAGVTAPVLVVALGWTAAITVTALGLGAASAVSLRGVPHDPSPDADATPRHRPDPPAAPSPRPAARGRTLTWIGVYALLMGAGIASVYAYLPLYAVDELGLSVTRGGLLASLIGSIGVASRVIWGAVAQRLRHPAVGLTALAGTAVLAQGLVWSAPALGAWAAWTAAIVLGASAVAWNAVAMFTVVRVLGAGAAGANSGLIQLAFFSGFAIGPLGFGALSDLAGGYDAGWAATLLCFAAATVVSGRWAKLAARGDGDQPSASPS